MDHSQKELLDLHRHDILKYRVIENDYETEYNKLRDEFMENIRQITMKEDELTEKFKHEMKAIATYHEEIVKDYERKLNDIISIRDKLVNNSSSEFIETIFLSERSNSTRDVSMRKGKISNPDLSQFYTYTKTTNPEKLKNIVRIPSCNPLPEKYKTWSYPENITEYLWTYRNFSSAYYFYCLFALDDGNYGLLVTWTEPDLISTESRTDEIIFYIGSRWQIIYLAMTDDIYRLYISSTRSVSTE